MIETVFFNIVIVMEDGSVQGVCVWLLGCRMGGKASRLRCTK